MANGQANISPTNEVIISIKVESGQKGERGLTGLTPQLTVIDTITGAPNTNADVVISGTAENPELTFTIPQGRPFDIAARYQSINDLTTNTNPIPSGYTPEEFDLAIIQSNVEDEDNARLYIFDNNPTPGKGGWTFVSDLSGATGPLRELRFRPGTSILEWRDSDGINWIEGKDLALKFDFEVDQNNELILTIENPDEEVETINLTTTAEFGDGQNETVTSVKFINNNDTETDFQELGVYASFDGTEVTLTNPDTTTVSQELALSFDWDDTQLGVKTPTDLDFTYQKLSPDIDFRDDVNGVEISVVEPGDTPIYNKISPDIAFQNIGDGLELSLVEPGGTANYNKISPDITWDGTQLAITEPDTAPNSGDYVELGVYGEFGEGTTTATTLTLINPDSTPVVQELGVYASFDSEASDTTVVLTNPDNTTVEQELGVYASFDSEASDTTLVLTNPDSTIVEQELGVYADFDGTELTLTNPDGTPVVQELGVYGSFDSEQSATTLVITNPDSNIVEQELGIIAEWGTIQQGTNRTLIITNPDSQQISRDLGIEFDWDGTQLGIKTADDQDFTYVDLKGETGDAGQAGTPLFKIRDEDDNVGQGFQVGVEDEIQFLGSSGIEVKRNDGTYTVELIEVDGGEF